MTKLWNVHHGSDDLGLKTAKEIREALRKGTLDPFDKVSAEGSNIREDLIEVDEIFKETQEDEEFTTVQQIMPAAEMGAGTSRARQQVHAPLSASRVKDSIARGPDPKAPRTNPPPSAPSAAAAAASWRTDPNQSLKDPNESKDSRATQKRYYLIDKSKILGPLSALEIQSLFNRGLLNQKVKVQRIGGTRSIPVAQFIATYSEDRLKELTDDGKLNQKVSSPSSKVLNELARVANAHKIAKTRQNKTYLILMAAGLLLGILVFVIFDSSHSSSKHSELREEKESAEGSHRVNRPKLLQKSQDDDDEDRPSPRAPTRPAPKIASPAPARERKASFKPTKRAPLAATPAPPPAPTPVKAPPIRAASRPIPPPPIPAPAPPPKKDSPIARAMSASGRGIQTIGPLVFSMGSLDSCASKCTLVLRDAAGATIKAVFFKSAYYDQLKKSSGSVFLTGTTRKESGELTIFIQDVR